jgi:hypothetical protein
METYNQTDEIMVDFNRALPWRLREKYTGLSFSDMAATDNCEQYRDFLLHIQSEWNRLELAQG